MKNEYSISSLAALGQRLSGWLRGTLQWEQLDRAVEMSYSENGFFTTYMQKRAIESICSCFLDKRELEKWLSQYDIRPVSDKKIGIVTAGNIPLVGFHDLLCVIVSGCRPIVKLSSKDRYLLPVLFPHVEYCSREDFEKEEIDALITMGGNRAADYYSKVFPCTHRLIRKNRFSIGVVSGNESEKELWALCEDIFLYFGLGCRSITNLFIGQSFDIEYFAKMLSEQSNFYVSDSMRGIYLRNKAILTMDGKSFIDANPFVLVEGCGASLPVGTVGYARYTSVKQIEDYEMENKETIQKIYRNFGTAQHPSLQDYPDGTDTLSFCLGI